jgi:hypothetical protein
MNIFEIGSFCRIIDIHPTDFFSKDKATLAGKKVSILDEGHERKDMPGFRICQLLLLEQAGKYPKRTVLSFCAVKLKRFKKRKAE